MVHQITKFTFFCAIVIVFSNCYYDNEQDLYPVNSPCDTASTTFSAYVKTEIINKCQSCHNNATQNGGINLEGYDNIKIHALNGNLLNSLNGTNGITQMPPSSKLGACNILKIKYWVNKGAPNN